MKPIGAILAGGRSVRMGQPKEGVIMPDGRKMIEPIIATLSQICRQIVIVGACRGFSIPVESTLLHLQDTMGMGPLAAMATLFKSGIDDTGYIITACDQPYLTTDLLRLLIQSPSDLPILLRPAIGWGSDHSESAEDAGRGGQSSVGWECNPFPGYYPVSWFLEIEKKLQAGERSICRVLSESRVTYLPFPKEWQESLRNLNGPLDLLLAS